MEILKCTHGKAATVLALLLVFWAFMAFSNSIGIIVDSSTARARGAAAGSDDLLQYEWPQIHGDPAFTRYSAGPAPEAPDITWKTTVKGIQSYVAAFNGKVFTTTTTNVVALDKDTGNVVWNTTLPSPQRWPTVYKIDDTHLVIGEYCLETETGIILWVSDEFSANAAYWAEGVYTAEEKAFYSQGESTVQAWNFSDPSNPPTLAWEAYVPGSGSVGTGIQYGDGKVFPGSFEPHQIALDARTGKVVWDTETRGAMTFSGSFYQGKFFKAGEHDNTFYCFDANTGKTLWTYNPDTQFGYWVSGCATAYGKVYELNKDGHLYALDVNTGQLVWRYKGPGSMFWPGWPVIADGKIYATTGQRASSDPYTGEYSRSEFACLDAYTGKLLWRLPIEAHAPRESVAVAYGNLYLIPGYIEENTMNSYTTLDEVWAIGSASWPMWRHDPGNTGTGQSGPTNLTLRWKFTTSGGVVSSPSIVDGKVYVGSNDRKLYCLDARSGRFIWDYTTGFRIKSSPAVVDGKVYIGPDDGHVYCLHAENGSLAWKRDVDGYVPAHFDAVTRLCSSPTVVGDRVYVGSLNTNLYCLDANSGNVAWIYNTTGYITSSPAVVDGSVYFTSQEPASGALYKLNAKNGGLIWKLEIPYQLTAERGTDMHASPTVADGMVFTASNKDEYYAVNATTGEIEWTYRITKGTEQGGFLVGSPAYHDGKLFLIDQFFIVCVDAKSGFPVWKSWLGGEIYASPTYGDGKVYVATDRRAIYVLNATNGDSLSWFETSSNCWSSPTIYEGRAYIGNQDWNIYCLADYPAATSNITLELEKNRVDLGESVTGCGQLTPEIAYTPITIAFVNPDRTIEDIQVITLENGAFNFVYTPDKIGNWTLTASWQSDKGYYASAYSENVHLEVRASYIHAIIVIIIVIVVIAAVGYLCIRIFRR